MSRARTPHPVTAGDIAQMRDARAAGRRDDIPIDLLPAVNLYEIYLANDMQVGFWIKRRTWGDLCARVTYVGPLERDLYCFGHPPVRADLFRFSTSELTQAGVEIDSPCVAKTWHRIPPPPMHVWGHARRRKLAA